MTQSDAQKHEWPTWDQMLHNKGHWNQKCKIKKVFGVHRNRPHTNTTKERHDYCTPNVPWTMHMGFCMTPSSANLFLNKHVLVGHPSVVHLDPTWVPCFTTKPIQTAAGLRCCTQRVEFQMSPLFCGDFLHSRASHWNPSSCWKLSAISKLDYKHMKLWIVQNVYKFSYQSHLYRNI